MFLIFESFFVKNAYLKLYRTVLKIAQFPLKQILDFLIRGALLELLKLPQCLEPCRLRLFKQIVQSYIQSQPSNFLDNGFQCMATDWMSAGT